MPGFAAFSGLSDSDLSCVYRALVSYLTVKRDGTRQVTDRDALYRLGHEAHRELERRFREGTSLAAPATLKPFANWDAFCRALDTPGGSPQIPM